MPIPSITTDFLILLALTCAALAVLTSRLRGSSPIILNGGILLASGLAIVAMLPFLSHLQWTDLIDEAADQAIAALQFLEATYVILTL